MDGMEAALQSHRHDWARTVGELRSSFESGTTRGYRSRQSQLTGLLRFLYEEQRAIQAGLAEDLRKSKAEALGEVVPTGLEILHAKRKLKRWMRDERVPTSLLLAPARCFVRREPLGVSLIFGAWNYPLHLTVTPLAGALAKPRALYLFTKDRAVERKVLAGTSSGGVCINYVGLQIGNPNLPFGDVGPSGIGAYHGKASFETFSHRKSVLKKGYFFDPPFLYPSYKRRKTSRRAG